MGYAQGTLLKQNASNFINSVWKYFEATVEKVLPQLPAWLAEMIF
jgi:hypothetical protein